MLTRAEVRFIILFYVFIAWMNPRFLKVALADQMFMTSKSETACDSSSLIQTLFDLAVREVLPGQGAGA